MIPITFNQKKMTLKYATSLAQLLHQQGYEYQTFAVAVNRCFVARNYYSSTILKANDSIDIISPMQGG